MKNFFRICFCLLPLLSFAQNNDTTRALLKKLDSVRNTSSVSRHFGKLYFEITGQAIDYFSTKNQPVQRFMQRLELRFAGYFFSAADLFNQKKELPFAWQTYYSHTDLSPLQYFLLGANAHINGDIWQALTSEFSLTELKENRRNYTRYNKELKKKLLAIHATALNTVPKARLLHFITLGLDKQYAGLMLVRWRKRQMKLALRWFTDKTRFEKNLALVKKKMISLDKLILQNL